MFDRNSKEQIELCRKKIRNDVEELERKRNKIMQRSAASVYTLDAQRGRSRRYRCLVHLKKELVRQGAGIVKAEVHPQAEISVRVKSGIRKTDPVKNGQARRTKDCKSASRKGKRGKIIGTKGCCRSCSEAEVIGGGAVADIISTRQKDCRRLPKKNGRRLTKTGWKVE